MVSRIIPLLLGCLLTSQVYGSFFSNKAEGWHWYKDNHLEKEEVPKNTESPREVYHTPSEIIKSYQKELEQKLHKAWVYPSAKNIRAYQEMQKDLMKRSQNFSETWMQVIFNHPHLDHTLVSPVNQKARHIYLDQQKADISTRIKALSQEYGLFFFFVSTCDYCHQFAPMVQQFSKIYGWEVFPISGDGGSLPEFPNAENDNGLISQWKVEVLPALFAVNPKTEDVIPIAYGLTSIDEIEARVMTLIKAKDK